MPQYIYEAGNSLRWHFYSTSCVPYTEILTFCVSLTGKIFSSWVVH